MGVYRRSMALWGLFLTVVIGSGCGGEGEKVLANGDRVPKARFTVTPSSIPLGDNYSTVVTLDASKSSDADGDSLAFQWDVMSGRFVEGTSAESMVAKATFPGSGDYPVTLTISDGRGGTASAAKTVRVLRPSSGGGGTGYGGGYGY